MLPSRIGVDVEGYGRRSFSRRLRRNGRRSSKTGRLFRRRLLIFANFVRRRRCRRLAVSGGFRRLTSTIESWRQRYKKLRYSGLRKALFRLVFIFVSHSSWPLTPTNVKPEKHARNRINQLTVSVTLAALVPVMFSDLYLVKNHNLLIT
jgi:hypothetical protein